LLKGAVKDKQTRTKDWGRVHPVIDGLTIKPTRNIVTGNGITVEAFRSDWPETGYDIGHVIHVSLDAGAVTAWHCHETQRDGIFVLTGRVLLVAYDPREDSPTKGQTTAVRLDGSDPTLVSIPPLVWHGLKALHGKEANFLNIITHPFKYEAPDEWRVPKDSPEIPFDIVNAV